MSCFNSQVLAVTTDGNNLLIKDSSGGNNFFHFDNTILKIVFSPTGQTIYVFDDKSTVWRKSMSQKRQSTNQTFQEMVVLPVQLQKSQFLSIVPFEKQFYIFVDGNVYITQSNNIISSYDLPVPISALVTVQRDIANIHSIIEMSNLPYIVVVGDITGNISRLSLPDQFIPIEDISLPLMSKSEPVAHILISESKFVGIGQFGTVSVSKGETGAIPHPIASVYIHANQMIFVSNSRLFHTSLSRPSSFKVSTNFTSRIVCASNEFILTTSGMIISIEKSIAVPILDPRPQFIEYALNRLSDISEEQRSLKLKLEQSETVLNDIQLIRAIKNGAKPFETQIFFEPKFQPDCRVIVNANIIMKPVSSFSCKGITLLLQLQRLESTETISIPTIKTHSINWIHQVIIVDPCPIKVSLYVFHGNESALVHEAMIDILDFSFTLLENEDVDIMNVSPVHSLTGQRIPTTIKFQLFGEIDDKYKQPKEYITPFNEKFSTRIDGRSCSVTAGLQQTALSVRAAINRRCTIKGSVPIEQGDNLMDLISNYANLTRSASTNAEPVQDNSEQQMKEFHNSLYNWIDQHISEK